MKTSRAFMTAVPLALVLIATLAVLVAATPGAFSFHRWPDAPRSALTVRDVVVDGPVARADARRTPGVERESTTVVVRAPQRDALDRRAAPVAAPSAPQVVAETAPEPDSDGGTSGPGAQEAVPQPASPPPLPLPELPILPALPAKDLPGDPDHSVPEWLREPGVLPRGLREDQD